MSATSCSKRVGDILRSRLRERSGEPVRGIGLPRPSVVVVNVLSNPVWEKKCVVYRGCQIIQHT